MRRSLPALAALAVLCMAPTAGDVGGCGAVVTEMDREQFAFDRKELDCRRCGECALASGRCGRACDPAAPPDTTLPDTCRPLSRDAVVCLRALAAASCDAFASYVADVAPALPTECEFCKFVPEAPSAPFAVDAATLAEAGAP